MAAKGDSDQVNMHPTDTDNYADHIADMRVEKLLPQHAQLTQITQLFVEYTPGEGASFVDYVGVFFTFQLIRADEPEAKDRFMYVWVDPEWETRIFTQVHELYAYLARFAVKAKAKIYTAEKEPWVLYTSCTLDLLYYTSGEIERRLRLQ